MKPEDAAAKQAELLNRVWSDDAFKARLKANPREVLEEIGLPVPTGVDIRVVEDTDTVKHLVVPPLKADA
jgi:hypothetical protein